MLHKWTSRVTPLNESCHTYECNSWSSHVAHMNGSCHTGSGVCSIRYFLFVTYAWFTSHIWIDHVTNMNESCHMYEWVMSHMNLIRTVSQPTHTNLSCHTQLVVCSIWWFVLLPLITLFMKNPVRQYMHSIFPFLNNTRTRHQKTGASVNVSHDIFSFKKKQFWWFVLVPLITLFLKNKVCLHTGVTNFSFVGFPYSNP